MLGERLGAGAAPEITALRGAEAMPYLLANTYANDFLDAGQRARELEVLGRLVQPAPDPTGARAG